VGGEGEGNVGWVLAWVGITQTQTMTRALTVRDNLSPRKKDKNKTKQTKPNQKPRAELICLQDIKAKTNQNK
jgi:hypothetical protein